MRIDLRFAVLALALGLTLAFSGTGLAQVTGEGVNSGPSGEVRMPVDKNVLPLDFDLSKESDKVESDKKESAADPAADKKAAAKKPAADKNAPAAKKKTPAAPAAKASKKASVPAKTVKSEPVKKPAAEQKKKEVAPAGYGVVKAVEMEQAKDGYVFWVYTDKAVEKTKYMNLSGPRRLVVDLMGKWKKHGPSIYRLEKGAIKHVRCGEHKDRLRLVIDFMDPSGKGEITPKLESVPKGLTITIPSNQL